MSTTLERPAAETAPEPGFHAEVTLQEGRLEGSLAWPGNALFRPTIGLFLDGRFRRSLPTRFAGFDGEGRAGAVRWRFEFAGTETEAAARGVALHVTCLELGRVLLHRPGGAGARPQPGLASLDELMAEARAAEPVPATAGFAAFLRLPVVDQIQILYSDILGRGVDEDGLASRVEAITSDRLTILDVRDALMASEELRDEKPPTIDQRIGHWCFWPGLAEVAPLVLVPQGLAAAGDAAGSFARHLDGCATTAALEAQLLRLAGAEGAERIQRSRWLLRQGATVASLAAQRAVPASPPARGHSRAQPLLAALAVGPAGERDERGIRNGPGTEGVLAYGPYLRLEPGAWRLDLGFAVTAAGAEAMLVAEVVAGDILFASAAWPLSEAGEGRANLRFAIPPDQAALLRNARYETRFSLRGAAAVRLDSVQIEADAEAEPLAYPAVADWLPLLTLGPGSRRQPEGLVAVPAGMPAGHMVYGPYVALLPGRYAVTACFRQANRRPADILLEVLGRDQVTLARQAFRIEAERREARLAFEVPEAAAPADLLGGLEFRITRLAASAPLVIESVQVGAAGEAEPVAVPAAVAPTAEAAAPKGALRRMLGLVTGAGQPR